MADWRVAGSYFEACNCEAICPCRRQGGQKLTTGSTYGVCDFALSWLDPSLRIAGGTDEVLVNTLAERILGLPQDYRPDKGVPFNQS